MSAALSLCAGCVQPQSADLESRLAALEEAGSELQAQNDDLRAHNNELVDQLSEAEQLLNEGVEMNVTEIPFEQALGQMSPEVAAALGLDEMSSQLRMRPTSPSSGSAEALRYTAWVAGDIELGDYYSVQFGETLMAWASDDMEIVTAIADFSGMHVACLGQPLCVIAMTHDGQVLVQLYEVTEDEGTLRPMQCVDWRRVGDGGAMPTAEQLRTESGLILVQVDGTVMCMRDINGLELSLYDGDPGFAGPLPNQAELPPVVVPQSPMRPPTSP
jgi:hypothetical protein